MRLLHVSTFKLENFVDEECPRYVILSHTWGKEEITYQEILLEETIRQLKLAKFYLMNKIINNSQQYKQGCLKIAGCALRADEDGADYIWCDTCCIDKTNSTELSEAINSMYLWYKGKVCYAYLADVPYDKCTTYDQRKHAFYSSRWFTRGWTLQELIAPASVQFFDAKWNSLVTRERYGNVIAKRTGIDKGILVGEDPFAYSVATRMSWASQRQTTRVEDLAYCLMGLFGVNMPLIYGEKQKAFFRLQTEIMKISEDHSLFAWKSHPRPDHIPGFTTCGLLANSPANFAGSSNVIPIVPDDEPREGNRTQTPFTMTSRGVNISLPLSQVNNLQYDVPKFYRLFFATLECQDTVDTRGPLGVFLVQYGGSSFGRCYSHRLDPAVDVAGRSGINDHRVVYVGQPEFTRRGKAQWRFSFHIPELPKGLEVEGAIMRVIPNAKNLSVHWASEKRQLELSSGLGAAIYIGRDVGYGNIFLIGIASDFRIRCVLHKENGSTDICYERIDVALNPSRAAFEWSVLEESFFHGHYYTGLHENLHTSLDLGQWVVRKKDHPRFYQQKYDKTWNPRKVEVYMVVDRTSLDGQWIYKAKFHKEVQERPYVILDELLP
ncbi:MAG: hypothetical protein Q9204_005460 [Flavoplaca sp. TL-2023a]